MEAVQGEDRATLNIGIGWKGLNEEMERFKDNMEFTKLKTKQEGVDPDDVYSQVPYEKGFQFLWCIEREVGWGPLGFTLCVDWFVLLALNCFSPNTISDWKASF